MYGKRVKKKKRREIKIGYKRKTHETHILFILCTYNLFVVHARVVSPLLSGFPTLTLQTEAHAHL